MIYNFSKNETFKKITEFKPFIGLILLTTIVVFIINLYDQFKNKQSKDLENLVQNIYLQKTLKSITTSLNPRYEKIIHIVQPGDNFDKIFNDLKLDQNERKKINNFINKNKSKFKIYINQKIKFEIDNLNQRKLTKVVLPISKKKDLIVARNSKNFFEYSEITKELSTKKIYKENIIKNSLYKSAVEEKIDPNIIVQFAQIYGFQVDFQRDIKKK